MTGVEAGDVDDCVGKCESYLACALALAADMHCTNSLQPGSRSVCTLTYQSNS